MKLKIGLLKKLSRRLRQLKCYKSIDDLPIVTWFKIHETQDFTLLYKEFNGEFRLKNIHHLIPRYFTDVNKVWSDIYDEYIKVIGLNEEYLAYLSKLKHIGILECECVVNPTPILLFELDSEKMELKEKETTKGVSYNEIIASISKVQGYSVRNVSVVEFYSYLKVNGK